MAESPRTVGLAASDAAVFALNRLFLGRLEQLERAGRTLAGEKRTIEIPIYGPSMGSALPDGTIAQIEITRAAACREGDVVVFLDDNVVVAHRLVRQISRGGQKFVITRGDARIVPDKPLPATCVLGRVIGVIGTGSEYQFPARRSAGGRLVVRLMQSTVAAALWFSPRLADGVVRRFVRMERRGARVLHWLRSGPLAIGCGRE